MVEGFGRGRWLEISATLLWGLVRLAYTLKSCQMDFDTSYERKLYIHDSGLEPPDW